MPENDLILSVRVSCSPLTIMDQEKKKGYVYIYVFESEHDEKNTNLFSQDSLSKFTQPLSVTKIEYLLTLTVL